MATQKVFEKAVLRDLLSVIVPSLERSEEFVIPVVLVPHNKPHWYHDKSLDFTSAPLQSLLSESEQQGFSFNTKTSTYLTKGTESEETCFNVNLLLKGNVSNNFY